MTPARSDTDRAVLRRGSRRLALAKTLSWRVVATTTTFLIAWAVTGDLGAGAAVGGIEAVAKMALYYGHERAWERVAPAAESH